MLALGQRAHPFSGQPNSTGPANSSNSFELRLTGAHPLSDDLELRYAGQSNRITLRITSPSCIFSKATLMSSRESFSVT